MSSTSTDKRVFHALDAGRGIAALVVVVFHLPVAMRGHGFGNAHLAVDFFFGLSGFVLAHAYLGKLASGKMGLAEFAMVRLVRLYPLYLLSLTAVLVWLAGMVALGKPIPWSGQALAGKLPFALLMLPSPSLDPNGYLYPFNIAAWSILFEVGINLVLAMACLRGLGTRSRWAVVVLSGAVLAVQMLVQGELGGASWNNVIAGIPRVFFSFFLGVQIYEWHQRRAAAAPPAIQGYWALVPLGLLLACLYAPDHLWLQLLTVFVFSPLLIMTLSRTELPAGRLGNALQRAGVLSYAVYVLHGTVLLAWMGWHAAAGMPLPTSALTMVGLLAAVLGLSWMADRWFDRPVRVAMLALVHQRVLGRRWMPRER